MTPILLTLTLVLLSNLIAVPLGVAWGWALDAVDQSCVGVRGDSRFAKRRSTRLKIWSPFQRYYSQFLLASLIGMLAIPLYIHAAGWEGAAGKFGWIPSLQGGARFWFSGIWAAAWIHGMYGACWIALATWWALRRRPSFVDQCARMDVEESKRTWLVDLPLANGWIIAAVTWNSVLVATEMTVADLYGVTTLADMVYKVYALDPQPWPVLSAVLLPAVLVIPFCVWGIAKTNWTGWTIRSEEAAADRSSSDHENDRPRSVRILPSLIAIAATLLVGVVPVMSLIAKAGWTVTKSPTANGAVISSANASSGISPVLTHSFNALQVWETLKTSAASFEAELGWTVQLAFSVVLVAVPVSLLAAAFAETNRWLRFPLLMGMLLVAMIPGPVISLAVIQFFNRPSLSILYDRTLVPSVFAVLPRAIPAAYLIIRAGYRMLDQSVLECAAMDGCGTLRRLCAIDAPRLWRPVLLSAVAILLIAWGDLSATLLVLPPSVSTVASRLFGLMHSGVRHQEAGLALIAAFCVGCVSVPLLRLVR